MPNPAAEPLATDSLTIEPRVAEPRTTEPLATPARTLSSAALPWLLSSTFHSAAMVVLALAWNASYETAPAARGTALEATFDLSGGGGGEDGASSVELDAPPTGGYFDDEPREQFAAEAASGTGPTGGAGGGDSLRQMLAQEPVTSLAGVLPAPGGGGGSGDGGSGSAIASAREAMGGPRPAGRLRGGTALTGVFGLRGEGYKFVYVFDRSGSMDGHGGAPLMAAKNELIKSLADLGQEHQFQIIFYNEEPRIFDPKGAGRLVFGTDQNKNLARRFVRSITASGATRHVEALEMALRLGPDVIFFLTDADEPQMTPRELAHIAQMNRGTSINTIEFGSDGRRGDDNFLSRLARQNGGQHVYVDVTGLSRSR